MTKSSGFTETTIPDRRASCPCTRTPVSKPRCMRRLGIPIQDSRVDVPCQVCLGQLRLSRSLASRHIRVMTWPAGSSCARAAACPAQWLTRSSSTGCGGAVRPRWAGRVATGRGPEWGAGSRHTGTAVCFEHLRSTGQSNRRARGCADPSGGEDSGADSGADPECNLTLASPISETLVWQQFRVVGPRGLEPRTRGLAGVHDRWCPQLAATPP